MNVWNEVKRIYEIQEELNNIPIIQVYKGSRQKRWLLESEKIHLIVSVDQEISMERNWFKKTLLKIAMWGVSQPEVTVLVNRYGGETMSAMLAREHKEEIVKDIMEEIQSRVDKD